jgi:hypothetical protein
MTSDCKYVFAYRRCRTEGAAIHSVDCSDGLPWRPVSIAALHPVELCTTTTLSKVIIASWELREKGNQSSASVPTEVDEFELTELAAHLHTGSSLPE